MKPQPITILLSLAVAAVVLAGCTAPTNQAELFGTQTGDTLESGKIIQAGSSTVLPLAEVWAEEFGTARGIQFAVAGGGSGRGATELCTGKIDLGDMSRTFKESELNGVCKENGVTPIQWPVAFDGLSVAVSNDNDFVTDLSVAQLHDIFIGEGHVNTWDEVDPSFPSESIRLCYPDDDSGTYEYFVDEILEGEEPRKGGNDVQQSPDDNVLVNCLKDDPYAIGFLGFAYVTNNAGKIHPIEVDGVKPTFETIADGSYTPLSRSIYIATDGVPTGILQDYFAYVFHPEGGQRLIESVGYVALDENTRLSNLEQLGV